MKTTIYECGRVGCPGTTDKSHPKAQCPGIGAPPAADVFTLRITLGNAAMSTPADVATALHRIARVLETSEGATVCGGSVIDGNGNKVGTWSGVFPAMDADGDA